MPRPRSLPALCLALIAFGCGRPVPPRLQPGDVVRPEISFAPEAPWPVGAKVTVGLLARVERPGGESHHLRDEDVPLARVVMSARIAFFDGDQPRGAPLDVPLVHDC